MSQRVIEILLVEDNPSDVHITMTALRDARTAHQIHVATDGEEALRFLRGKPPYTGAPRPDLVLLDLNLPKISGHDVLAEIKRDPDLRRIPVVVISGSSAESDLRRAYDSQIAGYLVKPVQIDQYFTAIRAIKEFWFHTISLPPKERPTA